MILEVATELLLFIEKSFVKLTCIASAQRLTTGPLRCQCTLLLTGIIRFLINLVESME